MSSLPMDSDLHVTKVVTETDYSSYKTDNLLDLLSVRIRDENSTGDKRRAFNRDQPNQASIKEIAGELERRMLLNDPITSNQIRTGVELIFIELANDKATVIRLEDAQALIRIFTRKLR